MQGHALVASLVQRLVTEWTCSRSRSVVHDPFWFQNTFAVLLEPVQTVCSHTSSVFARTW